jgi:hypothetical protein
MNEDIEKLAMEWNLADSPVEIQKDYYCESQDVFQGRLDGMIKNLIAKKRLDEGDIYVISAIAGEIGNNSFDHNIGNWPDIRGIFFGYQLKDGGLEIFLADRGRGIMETLKKVKPEIVDEGEAMRVAFFERISGRAPESRGNGLKFVRENVKERKIHLSFFSGKVAANLNQDFEIVLQDKCVRGCLAIIKVGI